jgi:hypothetical protein
MSALTISTKNEEVLAYMTANRTEYVVSELEKAKNSDNLVCKFWAKVKSSTEASGFSMRASMFSQPSLISYMLVVPAKTTKSGMSFKLPDGRTFNLASKKLVEFKSTMPGFKLDGIFQVGDAQVDFLPYYRNREIIGAATSDNKPVFRVVMLVDAEKHQKFTGEIQFKIVDGTVQLTEEFQLVKDLDPAGIDVISDYMENQDWFRQSSDTNQDIMRRKLDNVFGLSQLETVAITPKKIK